MRNEKTIEIQTGEKTVKKITVYEVRVKDALALLQDTDRDLPFVELAKKALPMCCDATLADLEDLFPSDIETLVEGFKEVNRPFLNLARAAGLGPVAERMKKAFMTDFAAMCAGLMAPATGTPFSTGTGSS